MASPTQGRMPPHQLEAEKSVLGAILIQNEAIFEVLELGLDSTDFYKPAHQKIFQVLRELSDRGEALDLITLTSALRDRNEYDSVGGSEMLSSLFEDHFAVGNVSHYAKIVKEKAMVRKMIDAAGEIISEGYEGVESVEAFLNDAETKVFSVSNTKASKSFSSMQDVLVENMHVIEELAQTKSAITGLSTGFKKFDQLTSGLQGGQLAIVAARPAMGKSSLVFSTAQYAAVQNQSVVALFSLEMSKEEIGFRLLSGLSKINAYSLKTGRLADRDWEKLTHGADQLARSKIFIDDSGDLTVMDIRARCRRLLSREKKLNLIIVDYLQLMKGSKSSRKSDGNREQEISEISRNLKGLAKELKVPIIALSQLNRGVESRQDKRPMLSDLRESGAIEQDADIVCFIYRDEVYNKETEDKGVAELIVAKHRAGETGTIRLGWLAEYTLFTNLAEDSPGEPLAPPRSDRGDVFL